MSQDWPHQRKAVADALAAIEEGKRRLCITSPTGGGKTRIAQRLIEHWQAEGLRIAVYTNRKLLVDQLGRVFDKAGLAYGVRAAGRESNLGCALQAQGRMTEAIGQLRRAVELLPDHAAIHSNLVFTLPYCPEYDTGAIAKELHHWNRLHAAPLTRAAYPHANDRSSDHRLRVGYVSPDFGFNVVQNRVHVRDLHATILHLLGIDHARQTFKFQGLDMRLTGVEHARVVKELLA